MDSSFQMPPPDAAYVPALSVSSPRPLLARFKTALSGGTETVYTLTGGNRTHGVVLSASGKEAVVHVPYYKQSTAYNGGYSAFDYLTVEFADGAFVDLALVSDQTAHVKDHKTNVTTATYNSTVRIGGGFPVCPLCAPRSAPSYRARPSHERTGHWLAAPPGPPPSR